MYTSWAMSPGSDRMIGRLSPSSIPSILGKVRSMADMPDTEPIDWRRRAARRSVLPLLIAAVGFVLVLIGKDDTLGIIGWGVVGLGVTVAIAYVFLEVGYSEDRERAAE